MKTEMTTKYLVWWALTIAIGSFYFGYYLLELVIIWDLIPWIYNSDFKERQFTNRWLYRISPISAAITAIATGALIHKGKRKLMIIANIIAIGAALLAQAPMIEIFFVARFLQGIVLGIQNTLVPIFLMQIAPDHLRGAFGSLTETFLVYGLFIAKVIGLFFPQYDKNEGEKFCDRDDVKSDIWRVATLFPIIPATLQSWLLFFVFK